MECNKEEANRAKQLAEHKMQKNDFVGALKTAEKAQRLFPDLENISQLLTVCAVHCSAENKLYGEIMDWYKILQLEQLAGEAAIKKQYRKLALLLHPDKNKFAGAEAAFKLIGEANRVLADPASRSLYDNRYRAAVKRPAPKPSSHQFNGNASVSQQHVGANHFPKVPNPQFAGTHHNIMSFWTCCFFCNVRYEYPKSLLHSRLLCPRCQRTFIAYDVGIPSNATGPSRGPFQNNGSVPSQGTKLAPENGKGSEGKKKEQGNVKKAKEAVDVKEDREDIVKSKSDPPVKPKGSATSRNTKRKRGRSSAGESSESCATVETDSEEDSVFQENGGNSKLNEGLERRKSSRQKQGVSYNEKLGDNDDDFGSSAKKPRGDDLSNNNAAPTTADCNEETIEIDDDDDDDDATSEPEILEYPDPDFSNFEKDKAENCFKVDQIWAAYDTNDSMPRFYARVRKVFSPGFKVRITWLEPNPDKQEEVEWCDEELPVACGKFKLGSTQITEDLPMFSHQITWMKGPGRNCFLVYPRKGEIWVLFKNWDINWRVEPEKHKPFKFEVVEVLSDFDEVSGITVAYLGKVYGFVSLFRQIELHGITSFQIQPTEIFRFSHRIPSFKMTGAEGKGVPEGSVELDPPSVPTDVDYFCDVVKNGKADTEVNGSCSNSPEKKVKRAAGSKKSGTPKKHDHEGETEECRKSPRQRNTQKNRSQVDRSERASKVETDEPLDSSKDEKLSDLTQPRGNATSFKVDKQSNTPKESNATKKGTLKSRRSPRALNNKQV